MRTCNRPIPPTSVIPQTKHMSVATQNVVSRRHLFLCFKKRYFGRREGGRPGLSLAVALHHGASPPGLLVTREDWFEGTGTKKKGARFNTQKNRPRGGWVLKSESKSAYECLSFRMGNLTREWKPENEAGKRNGKKLVPF